MKYFATLAALSLAATPPSLAFTSPATRTASAIKRPREAPQTITLWNSMDPNQGEDNGEKNNLNPTPALANLLQGITKDRNALVATAALATALSAAPMPSDAAMSGGRMGGSFGPSMSRSYSAPRSSYSGGGYSRGYGGGYSRGYYARPSYIAPMPFVTPYFSPFGVVSYGTGGLLPLFLLGGLALTVSNVVGSIGRSSGSFFQERTTDSVLGGGTSVVKMSVAVDVSNRDDPNSILLVLERLSTTARTDSRMGIQNLSSQVALELLRRKSSISAASTDYTHFRNREKAQRHFNSVSVTERGKFEKETISKFGGVDYSSGEASASSSGFNDKATMVVVTLVLAVDGDSTKVPKIRSMSDVEDALRTIASDVRVSDCLQGAEILWTPEDRSETLSFRDVVADYPDLNSV